MNYLAHLYLSEPDEESWLGAIMGDFVKGPLQGRFAPGITQGIIMHRRIDTFTDAHAVVARSKARISPARRRFAGIMVDMFYDHFLARRWADLHGSPLTGFTSRIYAILGRRHAILPERLQRVAPMMASGDWLGSYAQVEAVRVALDNMGRRFNRVNTLQGSADELLEHYAALEADFLEFLPDVYGFARGRRSQIHAARL